MWYRHATIAILTPPTGVAHRYTSLPTSHIVGWDSANSGAFNPHEQCTLAVVCMRAAHSRQKALLMWDVLRLLSFCVVMLLYDMLTVCGPP